jgi:hypothetical protein
MWSLGRGLVAIQLCFLHIEEKRLADFCAGEKSKMNRRYSKNSLYARSLYAGGATCLYLRASTPSPADRQMPFRFFFTYNNSILNERTDNAYAMRDICF